MSDQDPNLRSTQRSAPRPDPNTTLLSVATPERQIQAGDIVPLGENPLLSVREYEQGLYTNKPALQQFARQALLNISNHDFDHDKLGANEVTSIVSEADMAREVGDFATKSKDAQIASDEGINLRSRVGVLARQLNQKDPFIRTGALDRLYRLSQTENDRVREIYQSELNWGQRFGVWHDKHRTETFVTGGLGALALGTVCLTIAGIAINGNFQPVQEPTRTPNPTETKPPTRLATATSAPTERPTVPVIAPDSSPVPPSPEPSPLPEPTAIPTNEPTTAPAEITQAPELVFDPEDDYLEGSDVKYSYRNLTAKNRQHLAEFLKSKAFDEDILEFLGASSLPEEVVLMQDRRFLEVSWFSESSSRILLPIISQDTMKSLKEQGFELNVECVRLFNGKVVPVNCELRDGNADGQADFVRLTGKDITKNKGLNVAILSVVAKNEGGVITNRINLGVEVFEISAAPSREEPEIPETPEGPATPEQPSTPEVPSTPTPNPTPGDDEGGDPTKTPEPPGDDEGGDPTKTPEPPKDDEGGDETPVAPLVENTTAAERRKNQRRLKAIEQNSQREETYTVDQRFYNETGLLKPSNNNDKAKKGKWVNGYDHKGRPWSRFVPN